MQKITHQNLSVAIAERIRHMIHDGHFTDGQRINEVHLARDLGVSRTPLREALGLLTGEGALQSEARRGFFVQPLTEAEFRAIYPLRGLLDPEALRLAGLPSERRLNRLRAMNRQIVESSTADMAIDRDDAWHLALIEGCPNPVLIDLVRQFMARTRRYELAYFRERTFRAAAADEHDLILEALAGGDIELACRHLKQNLTSGSEPIIHWLQKRNAP